MNIIRLRKKMNIFFFQKGLRRKLRVWIIKNKQGNKNTNFVNRLKNNP